MGWRDLRAEPFKRTDDQSIDMNIDGSGAAKTFRVAAPPGQMWWGGAVQITIVDATGWRATGFGAQTSNLTNGVILRKKNIDTSEVIWSWTLKRNFDLYDRMERRVADSFADNRMIAKFRLKPPSDNITIELSEDEVLEIVVQDDLTFLDLMHAAFFYGV